MQAGHPFLRQFIEKLIHQYAALAFPLEAGKKINMKMRWIIPKPGLFGNVYREFPFMDLVNNLFFFL
jgi:hypothetical protein